MTTLRIRRMVDIDRVMRKDLHVASTPIKPRSFHETRLMSTVSARIRAQWTDKLEQVYRVFIHPATGVVEVICLGIDSVDSAAEGTYDTLSQAPQWLQEKVSLLRMMKVDPPQTKVEGVGMRVDEDVFWVLKGL